MNNALLNTAKSHDRREKSNFFGLLISSALGISFIIAAFQVTGGF